MDDQVVVVTARDQHQCVKNVSDNIQLFIVVGGDSLSQTFNSQSRHV